MINDHIRGALVYTKGRKKNSPHHERLACLELA